MCWSLWSTGGLDFEGGGIGIGGGRDLCLWLPLWPWKAAETVTCLETFQMRSAIPKLCGTAAWVLRVLSSVFKAKEIVPFNSILSGPIFKALTSDSFCKGMKGESSADVTQFLSVSFLSVFPSIVIKYLFYLFSFPTGKYHPGQKVLCIPVCAHQIWY